MLEIETILDSDLTAVDDLTSTLFSLPGPRTTTGDLEDAVARFFSAFRSSDCLRSRHSCSFAR